MASRAGMIRSATGRAMTGSFLSQTKERQKERKQWIKSRKAFEEKSALGRLFGGAGGALAANVLLNMIAPGLGTIAFAGLTAAGAGLGSRGGQELAVGASAEAKKKPGLGIWDVESGREEREAEKKYRSGAMGTRAFSDAQSAFFASLVLGQLGKLGQAGGETFPIQPGAESARSEALHGMLSFKSPSAPRAPFAGTPSLQRRGLIQNLRSR